MASSDDIREKLRQTIAEIFQTRPQEIGPEFPLRSRRLEGSVGRGILDAALRRRLGVRCSEVYSVRTYGELEAAVTGVSLAPVTPEESQAPAATAPRAMQKEPDAQRVVLNGLACGVDIEMIENLPVEEDYWEADFYTTFFSRAEIAYCLAQENPRMHFAARWCAKEALKKCDPSYLGFDMKDIEVTVDAAGKPSLQVRTSAGPRTLLVALSMSHTAVMATAIVVSASSGASG